MPPKKHKSSHYHKSDQKKSKNDDQKYSKQDEQKYNDHKKPIFDDFDRETVICKDVKPMKNRYKGGKPPKTIYRN